MKKFSYMLVADSIVNDFILSKKIAVNHPIPTEQFLMDLYDVSRTTIRKSIKTLIDKNILYTIQGSGTFVKLERQEVRITHLDNFKEHAHAIDKIPVTKVTLFEIVPATIRIASLLHINIDEPVYHTKRVRYLNDEPVLIEISYMPVELFPDLTFEAMSNSKYEYIEKQKKMVITKSNVKFDPIILDSDTANTLKTIPDIPAISIKSQSYLENDIVFEYTEAIRNPQKYDITIETKRYKKV